MIFLTVYLGGIKLVNFFGVTGRDENRSLQSCNDVPAHLAYAIFFKFFFYILIETVISGFFGVIFDSRHWLAALGVSSLPARTGRGLTGGSERIGRGFDGLFGGRRRSGGANFGLPAAGRKTRRASVPTATTSP